MKQRTKITITALVVMLMMALAVTMISFVFADENNGGTGNSADLVEETTATNIDYIIKNSNDDALSENNQMYRIVEIHSGKASTLKEYATGNGVACGFEEYVINGNKSINLAQVFATGKVKYNDFNAATLTPDSTTANAKDDEGNPMTDFAVISQADLIYISNSSNPGFSSGNDISEDLLSLLQPMAVGSYIPIIIDMPSKSGANTPGVTPPAATATVGNVIRDYYVEEGKYYYTFGYNSKWTAKQYFDTGLTSGSIYLPISAKTQANKGLYSNIKNGDDTASMSKMLVISKSGGALNNANSMASKLFTGATKVTGATYATTAEGETPAPVIAEGDTKSTVYRIKGTTLYDKGYNIRTDMYNPTYTLVEDISLADLATKTSLDEYDMVFVEADVKDETASPEVSRLLTDAMIGGIHVTYDTAGAADVATSTGDDGGTNTAANNTNYKKFYDMLASSDVALYPNVMITDKSKLDVITSSVSAAVAKPIADLINASSYRGIGGPKSTASSFAVLEIQPCYPIDETIAQNNITAQRKGYYNDGDAMINGMSLEEIQAQRELAGLSTDLDGSFEYYAWELSKAKIADALDMNVADITLTQMSTEEFSSYKEQILGKYDLVYIGGNNSAIKSFDKYYSWYKFVNDEKDAYLTRVIQASDIEALRYLPIYRMYSHNGDIAAVNESKHVCSTGTGTPLLKTVNTKDGNTNTYNGAITMQNGNDLSSDNLSYLKDYVDAGMPIVFSSDVSNAYNYIAGCNGSDEKYLQNNIDPDSNMCKLLDYCKSKTSANNILWDFHAVDKNGEVYTQEVSSDSGRLSAYANKVMVLNDDQRTKLEGLYQRAAKKPMLVLTDSPAIYNFFDSTTIITKTDLTYRIDKSALKISDYEVALYIDDDGNSKFSEGELSSSATITEDTGKNEIRINLSLDDKFFGPLYWKVELTDKTKPSQPKVFVSGLSYVRPETANKQEVSVLQLMPETRNVGGTVGKGEGSHGLNTLYFCVDCQEGYKNLYYNPSNHSSTFGQFSYYYSGGLNDNGNNSGTLNGVKMGLHEHRFGIVSYDSSMYGGDGGDDWSHNLADDLKNYYNFDIDIMYVSEFERYSREIVAAYDGLETDEDKESKAEEYNAGYLKLKEAYDAQVLVSDSAANALKDMISSSTMMASAKKEILAKGSFSEYYGLQDTEKGVPTVKAYKVDGMYYTQAEYNSLTDAERTGAVTYSTYNELYQAWVEEHDKALLLKGGYYINNYTNQYLNWYLDILCSDITDPTEKANKKTELAKTYATSLGNTSGNTDGGIANAARIMGYKDFKKYSNYGNWLNKTYTTVILGASERFADSDITDETALRALDNYVDANGQLIMFHDTLSPFSDSGAVKLTEHMRARAGVDKYHMVADTTNVKDTTYETYETDILNNAEMKFKLEESYDWQAASISPAFGNNQNSTSVSVDIKKNQWNGNLEKSELNLDQSSYYANDGVETGETKYQLTFKNYDGTPIANKKVIATATYNSGITQSATTDANGYVEFTIPNYVVRTVVHNVSAEDLSRYMPYVTTDETKYPASVYYMTNVSYKSGDAAHTNFVDDFKAAYKNNNPTHIFVPGGYTDSIYEGMNGSTNIGVSSYKYAEVSGAATFADMQDSQFSTKSTTNYGTNRAKKNNNAIVTMYPYQLADQIYISGTHAQAFATDVDDDDLTVLYSFIGGTPGHETTSTFAANPGDGTDNYFMYAYKSVYYCGAGHMKVTGKGADNQNERYLYLNIICNAVRNSAFAPTINVYDQDSTESKLKNDVVKKQADGTYVYQIEDDVEYPNFSFKAGVDSSATLDKVEIYYDLDYLDTYIEDGTNADNSAKKKKIPAVDGYTVGTDVMIATWGAKMTTPKVNVPSLNESGVLINSVDYVIKANVLGFILGNDTDNLKVFDDAGVPKTYLKIKDSYFAPYGGNYTYIAIKVTDSNGNVRYQRIKITRKEKLFNLT